ncbi:MAG: DUF1343 domain-containing protein [Chlorobiota bacterium]
MARGLLVGIALWGAIIGWAAPVVELGVERFVASHAERLRGKGVAVLTHAAARLPDGRLSLELLVQHFRVVAVWAPEHGFWGTVPAGVPVQDDTILGLPVYSLYGARRRPSAELFRGVEGVIVDLQDVGIRPFTYLSTLVLVMDACAERGVPVYVLDRPNPLGGIVVEGAVLDTAYRSFVGMLPIPYRHGCTLGELARMLNAEGWLPSSSHGTPRRCSLEVVPLRGWRRQMVWEDTGLPWFPPSPNVPTPTAARAMLLTGILGEMGLWSVGIGTATPFQWLGAPGFPAGAVVERVRQRMAELGVVVGTGRFVPSAGPYARQECHGIFFAPRPSAEARFLEAFVVLLEALWQQSPQLCQQLTPKAQDMLRKVLGSEAALRALCRGESLREWLEKGLGEFQRLRQRYSLYQ